MTDVDPNAANKDAEKSARRDDAAELKVSKVAVEVVEIPRPGCMA